MKSPNTSIVVETFSCARHSLIASMLVSNHQELSNPPHIPAEIEDTNQSKDEAETQIVLSQ